MKWTLRSLAWAVLLCCLAPAMAQDTPPAEGDAPAPADTAAAKPTPAEMLKARRDREKRVRDAIAEIKKEAVLLGEYKDPAVPPKFKRPHPAIAGWGEDMALPALNGMFDDLTGNDYFDSYIRWHLMFVVNKGNEADRREMGEKLVRLIQAMPDAIDVSFKQEVYYDPPEKWSEYIRIINSLRVVDGIPPFEKRYDPPASFRFMTPEQRANAEVAYKKALELRGQFTTRRDMDAIRYNARVREMNWVLRQYRGELIYAMVWTGDPKILRLIFDVLDQKAREKKGIAFDLLNYLYLGAFEGALSSYDQELLDAMSDKLNATARALDDPKNWIKYASQDRFFSDYAFHMIYMLKDGGGFIKSADRGSLLKEAKR